MADEQIAACGFHSLQAPATIQAAIRWKTYRGELGDCLAIPFFDADGKPLPYVRLKPDRPRKAKADGKPIKYESPKGAKNRPFFPPGTRSALADVAAPLVLTEGEKKAAKADQDEIPCIGLVGVYGWQKKRQRDETGAAQGGRELIDDLASIPWQGRLVFLCFDSDAVANPMVRRAEWHLAETLKRHGAAVKIIRLPSGEPDRDGKPAKVGLDDYLVAHGADAFRLLMESAADATEPDAADLGPNESVDNPTRLAREFIEAKCQHADGSILRQWRGESYRWDGSAFRSMPQDELRAIMHPIIQARFEHANLAELAEWQRDNQGEARPKKKPTVRKITPPLLNSVDLALSAKTILPSSRDQPFWIGGKDNPPANELLVCRNGMVHLPTLIGGNADYFFPSTPRFFNANALDYDFSEDAPPPAHWLTFLAQLWPDDRQSIELLQEWFGYCLTLDTRQQKIALLIGPPRSGKGTIGRVKRSVIGEANCAGPTLAGLGTNFGLGPLLNKSVAIISDARLSHRTDAALVTERLLSISGEDALTIDRKYLQPITAKLTARFMIISNELPRLSDSSGALAGRFLILRLTRTFFGKEDIALGDRLVNERAGILLWAIEGWRRLIQRGHFLQPDAGLDMLADLQNLTSPVGAFVRECCATGDNLETEVGELYRRWQQWCADNGRKESGTAATFGRDLRAAVPRISTTQPRSEGGGRRRVYLGIAIAS